MQDDDARDYRHDHRAQAEIDRLRAENARLRAEKEALVVQLDITRMIATEKADENRRLRAALAESEEE